MTENDKIEIKFARLFDDLRLYAKDEHTTDPIRISDDGNTRIQTASGNAVTVLCYVAETPKHELGLVQLKGSLAKIALDSSLFDKDDRIFAGLFCSLVGSVIAGSPRHGLRWHRAAKRVASEIRWVWEQYGFDPAMHDIPYTNKALAKALKGDK